MKKINKTSKVGFLIHTFGPIDPCVYFNHIGTMMSWASRCKMFFGGIDKTRSARARNILVETAISAGCTHLIFIDADHIVPDHMLEVLSLNDDAQIVSGLICKRKPPYQQVGFIMVDEAYREIRLPLDGRSYFVDIPAMGCTMFDIEVFKKIKRPWFVDVEGIADDGTIFNKRSDFRFFEAAGKAGIKMCIDTRVVIGHVGDPQIHYPSNRPRCEDMNRDSGIRMDADSLTWQAPVYEAAKEIVKMRGIESVLDLGCGNPIKLKDINASIVGVDFPEKIEAISRVKVEGEWIGRDLNYEFDLERKFGLIIAADVIEHLNAMKTFFSIVKKHLAEDGVLLLSSPEASSTSGRNLLHVQEFTIEELTGMIGAHGFAVIEVSSYENHQYKTNIVLCERKRE